MSEKQLLELLTDFQYFILVKTIRKEISKSHTDKEIAEMYIESEWYLIHKEVYLNEIKDK